PLAHRQRGKAELVQWRLHRDTSVRFQSGKPRGPPDGFAAETSCRCLTIAKNRRRRDAFVCCRGPRQGGVSKAAATARLLQRASLNAQHWLPSADVSPIRPPRFRQAVAWSRRAPRSLPPLAALRADQKGLRNALDQN